VGRTGTEAQERPRLTPKSPSHVATRPISQLGRTTQNPWYYYVILNTTPEQANSDYLFGYLIENFADIKASWEQKIKEAHEGKTLIPVNDNVDKLKRMTDFLKSKGGDVNVKPDLSFDIFNVAVDAKFKEEFTINRKDIEMLNKMIEDTVNFEIDASPSLEQIQIRFTLKELGRYVDSAKIGE
jgi:hypothetical protein